MFIIYPDFDFKFCLDARQSDLSIQSALYPKPSKRVDLH